MKAWVLRVCLMGLLLCQSVMAVETDVTVSQPQDAIPPNIVNSATKPMVMLAASKDHTLFSPIYTDYEDLDGDGVIDVTYKSNFKYYGYFDATKCYHYINSIFEPESFAEIKADKGFKCSQNKRLWSGNFMNWMTTTRLDVVRKMLYGGKRFIDGSPDGKGDSVTILESAYLSSDSHSYVKHYYGSDIRDFTPFSVQELTVNGLYSGLTVCNTGFTFSENGVPHIRMAKGNYRMWGTLDRDICTWSNGSFGNKLARYYIDADKGGGKVPHQVAMPTINDSANYGVGSDLALRVRVCVPEFIGEERCQAFPENSTRNFKPYGIFQEFAMGPYYRSNGRVEFGVISGSYDRNINAGSLRKNMGDFRDEINYQTGVFCHSESSGCAGSLGDGRLTGRGAIKAFDSILLFGRVAGARSFTNSRRQLPSEMVDGELPAWGNTIGEMVVQSLNYYAGLSGLNPAPPQALDNSRGLFVANWNDPFTLGDEGRKNYYGEAMCRPLYTLALSSSASSFDYKGEDIFANLPNREMSLLQYTDKVGVAEGVHGTVRSVGAVANEGDRFGEHCGKKMVTSLAAVSGICPEAAGNAGTFHIAGAALYANTRRIRNPSNPPKDLNKVKNALRVKMLAATLAGGVARIEVPIPNSNPLRYVYITPESLWNISEKRMPGAQLSFGSISSSATHGAFMVSWNDVLFGGDYDMDMTGFIRYDIIENGDGSHDISVKTDIVNVGGGAVGTHGFSIIGVEPVAGSTMGDGRYLTHRSKGDMGVKDLNSEITALVDGNMHGALGYECDRYTADDKNGGRCNVAITATTVYDANFPVVKRFRMVGVNNVTLHEPLWYAAKYGGFDSNRLQADGSYAVLNMPPNQDSWDKYKNDGSAGSDGVPDNFFLARRPELLESQLRKALEIVADGVVSSPALSSPTAIQEGEFKYEGTFDNAKVTGEIAAFKVKADGTFPATANWQAGALLHAQHAATGGALREIITNEALGLGVPFRWTRLSDAYKARLTTESKNKLSLANAQIALNYIRGAQAYEADTGLRVRERNLLGPVVNASPWMQTRPMANVVDSSYRTFYEAQKERSGVLWVAANDGMLHAFNAKTGAEIMAYVPGVLANRLAEIPLQRGERTQTLLNGSNFVTGAMVMPQGTVWPYVDGSPYSADVRVGNEWHTYLFGSLGRGGKAVYALNVTHIDKLKESYAADVFKWQFTSKDDADLGYIVAKPQMHTASNQPTPVVRLNNGKYALLLGNGQQSSTGRAVLFILYVDGPQSGNWTGKYRKIVLDASQAGNGLSTPQWEDLDGNGTADIAYAGDLKGGVWRIDLSSSDPEKWGSHYTQTDANGNVVPRPFFRAQSTGTAGTTVALPITTAPTLLYMGRGGLMVNFITGNAFTSADFPNVQTQNALFGVWDRGNALDAGGSLLVRGVQRDANGDLSLVSGNGDMDWSHYNGWRMPLPASGEAGLSNPFYTGGILTAVITRPMVGQNVCLDAPRNTLLMLDPISGRAEREVLGTLLLSGVKHNRMGKDIAEAELLVVNNRRPTPKVVCKSGEVGCVCTGTNCVKAVESCPAGYRVKSVLGSKTDENVCFSSRPRLQWREIPGIKVYP